MGFEKRSTDVKVEAVIGEEKTQIACESCGKLREADKECSCKQDKNEMGENSPS